MSLLKELQSKFKSSGIIQQLIYINIGAFILAILIGSFSKLGGSESTFIGEWFALSSSLDIFITRPWTLVTYGFLHGGFLHILFNCLFLFFFGRMFLDYFSPKQLLNFYILGTVFGGIMFMLAYNVFPLFENTIGTVVGASAAVSAIVIGIATYIPNYQINLRFIGYVKLWHIAAIYILMDLASLAGGNAGGHFAHLGGALFGYFYVQQASNQKKSYSSSSSSSGSIFDLFKKKKQKPLKTVHRSKTRTTAKTAVKNNKSETQQKIDAILDKISKSGYDTLSKEEKEFLFKQKK
jgi:membrane associated rhomboid family serine protease